MMKAELIAPCGMNCGICKYYYREKKNCPGCRTNDETKATYCTECIIINCTTINTNKSGFCYECETMPCKRLKTLDKRYKTKYHMSMLDNLKFIKEHGIKSFLEKERKKWICPQCNETVTCHGGMCMSCGFEKFKD
jgi:hypothetical protein